MPCHIILLLFLSIVFYLKRATPTMVFSCILHSHSQSWLSNPAFRYFYKNILNLHQSMVYTRLSLQGHWWQVAALIGHQPITGQQRATKGLHTLIQTPCRNTLGPDSNLEASCCKATELRSLPRRSVQTTVVSQQHGLGPLGFSYCFLHEPVLSRFHGFLPPSNNNVC